MLRIVNIAAMLLVDPPPKSYLARLFAAENLPNLLLVVIGAVGIVVATVTVGKVSRQADLMDDQADQMEAQTGILELSVAAAQLSAEAAKASADLSRGVSLPHLVIHDLGVWKGVANTRAFFQYPRLTITLKNYGQTPAFLLWWTLCFSCEDLSQVPVYTGKAAGMILKKIVIQPNETLTLPPVGTSHRQEFPMEDVERIVRRQKPFHVYGYVCYRDIFGNPLQRLKFCETVLNIFGDEDICDWWEGLAPPAYIGTEPYPRTERTD